MCPVSLPDPQAPSDYTTGIVIATSTPASTALQKENTREYEASQGVSYPFWMELEAWWYAGLAFLNFDGIANPKYQGHKLDVSFGQLLRPSVSSVVSTLPANLYSAVPFLLHFATCFVASVRRYGRNSHSARRSTRIVPWTVHCIFGAGIDSPPQEAHFLLNTDRMPRERRLIRPDQWYYCNSWYSYGQKDCVAEWNLEYLAAMMASDKVQLQVAVNRINVLDSHLHARL